MRGRGGAHVHRSAPRPKVHTTTVVRNSRTVVVARPPVVVRPRPAPGLLLAETAILTGVVAGSAVAMASTRPPERETVVIQTPAPAKEEQVININLVAPTEPSTQSEDVTAPGYSQVAPGQPQYATAPGYAQVAPGQPQYATAPGYPVAPGQPPYATAPGYAPVAPGQPQYATAPGYPPVAPGQPQYATAPGYPPYPVAPGQPQYATAPGYPPCPPGQYQW